MSIKILRSTNGQYFARVVASNGATVFWSETYVQKADAVRAAQLLKAYAAGAPLVDNT